jgi:hypothetical protein
MKTLIVDDDFASDGVQLLQPLNQLNLVEPGTQ